MAYMLKLELDQIKSNLEKTTFEHFLTQVRLPKLNYEPTPERRTHKLIQTM